jgi:hypothetical protein
VKRRRGALRLIDPSLIYPRFVAAGKSTLGDADRSASQARQRSRVPPVTP